MKTLLQTLPKNLFAENRMARMSPGGNPEPAPVAPVQNLDAVAIETSAAPGATAINEEVKNFGCDTQKAAGTTITVKSYDEAKGGQYTLSDGSVILLVEIGPGKVQLLRKVADTYLDTQGKPVEVKAAPTVTEAEVKANLQESYDKAKAALEAKKAAAINEAKKTPATEADVTKAAEQAYATQLARLDEAKAKAEVDLGNAKAIDGTVAAEAAKKLEETFGVTATAVEEGKEVAKAAGEATPLKNIKQLLTWLEKDPANKAKMRQLALGITGKVGKGSPTITVNFENAMNPLGLSSPKELEILSKQLSIGNLFADDELTWIKSIEGVQGRTGKGKVEVKTVDATHFAKGDKGWKRGVYAEKKYLRIWNGSKISFGDKELVELEQKSAAEKAAEAAAAAGRAAEAAAPDAAPDAAAGVAAAEVAPGEAAAAAAAPEVRATGSLEPAPKLAPLAPEATKPGETATFNEVEYRKEGASYVIVKGGKEYPVDAETAQVLFGQKVPDEGWMRSQLKGKFEYMKSESDVKSTVTYNAAAQIVEVTFTEANPADPANAGKLVATVNVLSGNIAIDSANSTNPGALLNPDISPEQTAQLNLDGLVATEINLSNEISKLLIAGEYQKVLDRIQNETSVNPKVLAVLIFNRGLDSFKAISTTSPFLSAAKSKLSEIPKIFEKNGWTNVDTDDIQTFEYLNGGPLSPELAESLYFTTTESAGLLYLYETYGSKSPKIAEGHLKAQKDLKSLGEQLKKHLLITNLLQYNGGEVSGEVLGKLGELYSPAAIDAYTLEDFPEPKPQDLEKAKETLKANMNKICEAYLAKDAGKKPENTTVYKQAYERLYGVDFAKLEESKAKEYASYIVADKKNILTDGVGMVTVVPIDKAGPYIEAYLNIGENAPISGDITRNEALSKKVYEVASKRNDAFSQVVASAIYRTVEVEAPKKLQARFDTLIKAYKSLKDPNEKLTILAELEESAKLYSTEDLTNLDGKGSAPFAEWVKEERIALQVEAGLYKEIDPATLPEKYAYLKEFVEAQGNVSTITSYAKLSRIIATKGVKREDLQEIAEDGNVAGVPGWAKIELFLALGMKGKAKELIDTEFASDEVSKNYYAAMYETDNDKKLTYLLAAANAMQAETPTTNGMEMRIRIFEQIFALNKDVIEEDLYAFLEVEAKDATATEPAVEGKSARSKLEDLAKQTSTDPDTKQAILRAKILVARVEIDQCGDVPGAMGERACEPKDLVTEITAYVTEAEAQKTPVSTEVLEGLYNVAQKNTYPIPEESKADYAKLMFKLAKEKKDKKYVKGLDGYLKDEPDYLEYQGKYLEAAQKIDASTATPEQLAKKKSLLAEALKPANAPDAKKRAEVAAEYAKIDEEGSQETAVDIYLADKNYKEAEALMKADNKVRPGFTKPKLIALVAAKQAPTAERVYLAKGLCSDLIRDVYMSDSAKEEDVSLGALLEAAKAKPALYDEIFALLSKEDGRKKGQFKGATDDLKKEFCTAKLAEITANVDTETRIEKKLGIDDVTEFVGGAAPEPAAAEPAAAEPAAAEPAAAEDLPEPPPAAAEEDLPEPPPAQ